MDLTTIKAGDEIGSAVIGHRVWRYKLGPPLELLSFCLGSTLAWNPHEPFQSDKEPNWNCTQMAHGVHAFKLLSDLREYFRDLPDLLRYRYLNEDVGDPTPMFDGVVRGTVLLWGVCIDHEHGYRAQYARPYSFDEVYGQDAENALLRLRYIFRVEDNG